MDGDRNCDWLSGAFTAIVTPFTSDGRQLDEAMLREQLAYQAGSSAEPGVHGVVAMGTTGESPTVTPEEANVVASICIELGTSLGMKVILGTGSNSTAHAVELQRWAAAQGADAALSVVPYYNKPMQEGLYRHFMEVADAADLPIVLYNIPGRCGTGMTPETIERLSRHPNIAAVKHATGGIDDAAQVHERCPNLILMSGDDPLTYPLSAAGASGAISVIGNILPGPLRSLIEAMNSKDALAAERLHQGLLPLARGLMSAATNPIGIKTAMALLGRDSGSMRLPMTSADDVTRERIAGYLRAAGMLSNADIACGIGAAGS